MKIIKELLFDSYESPKASVPWNSSRNSSINPPSGEQFYQTFTVISRLFTIGFTMGLPHTVYNIIYNVHMWMHLKNPESWFMEAGTKSMWI